MTGKYPEHDKLRLLQEKSQTCGEFIVWLNETKGWFLATFDETQKECRNCQHPDLHNERVADPVAFGQRACSYEDDETGECCNCDSADFGNPHTMYRPSYTIERLLAEFFDIDHNELEAEKQRMLTEMREMADVEGA